MSSDTQTTGGWPDAARPGYPQNPERTAYHWVQLSGGGTHAAYWNKVEWNLGRDYLRPCEAAYSWRYVAPCLTPAEVEACVAAARREGIEAAVAVTSKRAASRHSTVAHCHSDRSKKHMQIRADEAGQLVADIRALLEDGR